MIQTKVYLAISLAISLILLFNVGWLSALSALGSSVIVFFAVATWKSLRVHPQPSVPRRFALVYETIVAMLFVLLAGWISGFFRLEIGTVSVPGIVWVAVGALAALSIPPDDDVIRD